MSAKQLDSRKMKGKSFLKNKRLRKVFTEGIFKELIRKFTVSKEIMPVYSISSDHASDIYVKFENYFDESYFQKLCTKYHWSGHLRETAHIYSSGGGFNKYQIYFGPVIELSSDNESESESESED
jgi:hypothetical protein